MGFAPCCDFYFHSKVQPFIFRAIGHFIHLRCDSPYFLSGPAGRSAEEGGGLATLSRPPLHNFPRFRLKRFSFDVPEKISYNQTASEIIFNVVVSTA